MLFSVNDGATVLFDYAGGRLRRIRHVRGHELVLEWDGDRIVAVRADDGRRVEYRYDGAGRLVERARDGRTVRWSYNADGLRTSMTHPDDSVTRYEYDTDERVSAVEHPGSGGPPSAATRSAASPPWTPTGSTHAGRGTTAGWWPMR